MPQTDVERVREKYESQLLSIEGVVGVGIQRDEIGNDVIAVYVRDAAAKARVPKNLDGVPVKVDVSGEFYAK
ncbi:MAG: hypothetical protein U0768_12075 [Anaerolineae bacterium]